MKTISFTKMHGLGNDFMVIYAAESFTLPNADIIRAWADRHKGVGFDQLLLIMPSTQEKTDFNYRIFNADGNEVEQCGNGVRCVAQFIHEKKLSNKKELHLSTPFATTICYLADFQQVTVNMGKPNFAPASLPFLTASQSPYYELAYHDRSLSFGAVSMGNPHIVFDVPDLSQAEVKSLGTFFNQDAAFPQGVNVGFMQILTPEHIDLRVYERGAAETLACGTGACAAVSIGQLWQRLAPKVRVSLPGGDLLIEHHANCDLFMTGPAITVFDAELTTSL